jgi:hypothetical protein
MRAAERAIVRRRLVSQRIGSGGFANPVDVVRWMTAMLAQDLASASWSIGLRSPGTALKDVEGAFRTGSIIRSWPMRGTLHVVAPEDLRWMLALTSERLVRGSLARRAALGLDETQLETARDAAVGALAGGRALARDEIYRVFEDAGVATASQRGYHVLWFLAQTGTLCLGPAQGKQQTFVLLDEWAPGGRILDREQALGEFVLRYFRSHGPASIRDFCWWSSTTLAQGRVGLASARASLSSIEREGEELFFAEDAGSATDSGEPPPGGVRLLPGFDEYLLGYQDRTPQLSPDHAATIVPGGNGVFLSTIVEDGAVVGTWRRALTTAGVSLDFQPFSQPGTRLTRGIARRGAEYARFLHRTLIPAP